MTANLKKENTPNKSTPTALIAGGAGFIGSHLCEALLNQGYRVFCLDNLTTGSKENIKELLTNPEFHFIEADVTQNLDFVDGVESLDVIFHLASLETQSRIKKFSLETLLVNSSGTRNLLEAARKFKAKFVLVSSADIYQGSFSSNSLKYYFGQGKEEAVMSQHEAKRFAEALTVEFFKNYELSATIARVADVYGPRMDLSAGGELNRLIEAAKEGEKLLVAGDGLRTLNPTYVSDVVFGLSKVGSGDFKGEIFNLINPEKTTVMGLAETLRLIFGNLEIETAKSDGVEFPPSPLDLDETREKLKWNLRVTLAEGLSSTFQSFRGEVAKMVDFAPEHREETLSTKQEKTSEGRKSHLRLVIFSASLVLVILTTLVPVFAFVWNSREAGGKIVAAESALEADKVSETRKIIKQAQDKAEAADSNWNNVRWLFQLTGQREIFRANEQYVFGLESTATSIDLLSRALDNIAKADQASKDGDIAKAKDLLKQTDQTFVEVRQNLDLSKANLSQVKESKLIPFISSEVKRVKEVNQKLTDQSTSVANSVEESLRILGEPASTAP